MLKHQFGYAEIVHERLNNLRAEFHVIATLLSLTVIVFLYKSSMVCLVKRGFTIFCCDLEVSM